jgi:hypothetical protein
MTGMDLGTVLRRMRRLFDRPGYPTPTDGEVLARFLAEKHSRSAPAAARSRDELFLRKVY